MTNGWQRYCEKENWHPAANLFPMMSEEELTALVADLRRNGLQNPITVFEDKLLDGRNRALACQKAGITPSVITFTGCDALGWVLSQNLQRRNLTSSQRAAIAVEAEELLDRLAAEAKQRQRQGTQLIADPSLTGEVREKVADIFDTNRTYVSDMRRIKEKLPFLVQRIKDGTLSIPAAVRQVDELETVREEDTVLDLVWEKVSAFVSGEGANHPTQTLPCLLALVSSGRVFTDAEQERFEAIVNSLQKISVMTGEFHTKLKGVQSTVTKAA